ncbi:hypothetical protein CCACVL1_17950, partial [Corchorus capsularis]
VSANVIHRQEIKESEDVHLSFTSDGYQPTSPFLFDILNKNRT